MDLHAKYMEIALQQAQMAYDIGEVPVGAVVVMGDKIISAAHNMRETAKVATAHAEILAIEQACTALKTWRLDQCQIYVTLEPCPMCMGAIINSRIDTVIFGANDPKAGCCGSKLLMNDYNFNHKPKIISGIKSAECGEILQKFFILLRRKKL